MRYKGEERTYVPEEIISLVLKHLVATAEQQLMSRRITQVGTDGNNVRVLDTVCTDACNCNLLIC